MNDIFASNEVRENAAFSGSSCLVPCNGLFVCVVELFVHDIDCVMLYMNVF